MIGDRFCALALAVSVCAAALGADANERKFLGEGIGEGEVLLKIGKPDDEAFIRVVRGEPEEKTWSYFPHTRDSQTFTILTFHSSLVTRVERKIARWTGCAPYRGLMCLSDLGWRLPLPLSHNRSTTP